MFIIGDVFLNGFVAPQVARILVDAQSDLNQPLGSDPHVLV